VSNPWVDAEDFEPRKLELIGKHALFYHMVMDKKEPRHCGLFGGFGSGKSTAACLCGFDMLLRNPKVTGAVIRMTSPELRSNTQKIFMDLVTDFDWGKPDSQKFLTGFNMQYGIATFANRTTVYFLHGQSEALFKGPEFGWFIIDQVEEFAEEFVTRITTRLRQPDQPQKAMYVGNTDKGHNWCYNWFKLGRKKNSGLIECSFLDNAHNLKGGIVEDLLSYPEEWKRINLYGSWDSPGGLVIEPTSQHILSSDKVRIPPRWKRGLIVDPADSTGVTAAHATAVDFDGNHYVCREYYERGRIIREHALGIKEMWAKFVGEPVKDAEDVFNYLGPDYIIMDSSAWKKSQPRDDGLVTIAQLYREHGLVASKAKRDMAASLDLLRERHYPHPDTKHVVTKESPAPSIYFFRDDIPKTWEEIFSWMIEEPDKEPVHGCDCIRYFVAARLSKPRSKFMDRDVRKTMSWMAQ
jgi:hypothetical protein